MIQTCTQLGCEICHLQNIRLTWGGLILSSLSIMAERRTKKPGVAKPESNVTCKGATLTTLADAGATFGVVVYGKMPGTEYCLAYLSKCTSVWTIIIESAQVNQLHFLAQFLHISSGL